MFNDCFDNDVFTNQIIDDTDIHVNNSVDDVPNNLENLHDIEGDNELNANHLMKLKV